MREEARDKVKIAGSKYEIRERKKKFSLLEKHVFSFFLFY